jgi:hypothetical protein
VVDTFVEMFEMEIVEKKGTSCRRLVQRVCMPAVLKERACHPCFNGDVHVKLNFRVTR